MHIINHLSVNGEFCTPMAISSAAQQLLCARPTADVHMHNTCCAHVNQLLDGYLMANHVASSGFIALDYTISNILSSIPT